MDEAQAIEAVRALLAATAARLAEGGARTEALAEYVPARRVLRVQRRPVMRPLGRVWRLGVLLLETDGTLHATGEVTRAAEPGHPTHVARSIEDRREHQAAAFRGPFVPGETVNHDAPVLDLRTLASGGEAGPLQLRDGRLLVAWNRADAGAPAELAAYLAERADLLLAPPEGA